MQNIKPQRITFGRADQPDRNAPYTFITGVLGFNLLDPAELLTEQEVWRMVQRELGRDIILDLWRPKLRAEVLVAGMACAPTGKKVSAMDLCVELGTVSKRLRVNGDRVWRPSPLWRTPGDAIPFESMPIVYSRAYGGVGFAACPVGTGYDAPRRLDAGETVPVPNIEYPDDPVLHPGGNYHPAGFGPIDIRWDGFRATGTYDDAYLQNYYPGLPPDFDGAMYNVAPADQQIDGYFDGTESFALSGFHPEHSRIVSRLPAMKVRCFTSRASEPGNLREHTMRADTVWLFPSSLAGLLFMRAAVPVTQPNGRDLGVVMLAAEWQGRPKSDEHYAGALRLRTDPETSAHYVVADLQLMPELTPAQEARRARSREAQRVKNEAREQELQRKLKRPKTGAAQSGPIEAGSTSSRSRVNFPVICDEDYRLFDIDLAGIAAASGELQAVAEAKFVNLREKAADLNAQRASQSAGKSEPKAAGAQLNEVAPQEGPRTPAPGHAVTAASLSSLALDFENAGDAPMEQTILAWAGENVEGADKQMVKNCLDALSKEPLPNAAPSEQERRLLVAKMREAAAHIGKQPAHTGAGDADCIQLDTLNQLLTPPTNPDEVEGFASRMAQFASDIGKAQATGTPTESASAVFALLGISDPKITQALSALKTTTAGKRSEPQVTSLDAVSERLDALFSPSQDAPSATAHGAVQANASKYAQMAEMVALMFPAAVTGNQVKWETVSAGVDHFTDDLAKVSEALAASAASGGTVHELPAFKAFLAAAESSNVAAVMETLGALRKVTDAHPAEQPRPSADEDRAAAKRKDVERRIDEAIRPLRKTAMTSAVSRRIGPDTPARLRALVLSHVARRESLAKLDLAGADLHGLDLCALDMSEACFEGADLRGTKLSKARLDGATFVEARLDGAQFDGASLNAANLSSVHAPRADFTGARMKDVLLRQAKLSGARFPRTVLDGCDAMMADLSNADFRDSVCEKGAFLKTDFGGACFDGATWREGSMIDASLIGCRARQANFTRMLVAQSRADDLDLTGSTLDRAMFIQSRCDRLKLGDGHAHGASWFKSSLLAAVFDRASLNRANFSETHMNGSSFVAATLTQAQFSGAEIQGTTFETSQLFYANFSAARAERACFRLANLRRANLHDAKLDLADFTGANVFETVLGMANNAS